VAITGFNADLLGQLERRAASPAQIYLLQRVAQSIEPDTLLSQHAASLAGMATEVPRVQAALLSHGERLQPQQRLLGTLCKNAADAVARTARFRPNDKLLNDISAILTTAHSSLVTINDIERRRQEAILLAEQLDPLLEELPALLTEMFAEAWELPESKPEYWSFLDHMCDEFACLIASLDRDYVKLESDLTTDIRRNGVHLTSIIPILIPDAATYNVACIVRGASRFANLNDLESTAQQQPSSDSGAGIQWGATTRRLREFLDKVPVGNGYCAVSVDVNAVDGPSAARQGRRRVTELLDQYIAGHRRIALTLDSSTLVNRDLRTREWQVPRLSINKAYPLLGYWPRGLREGLRMSHIARTADSPLAAAALSWVTLEACGVEFRDYGMLAKVLSLQALRQQIVEAHQMISHSLAASMRYWLSEIKIASNWVRSHQTALTRIPASYEARREEVLRFLAREEDRRFLAGSKHQALIALSDESLAALNAYAAVDTNNHLADVNSWVHVLLPTRPSDNQDVRSARTALAKLIPHLTPLASRQIIEWQRRLSSPELCLDWLSRTQARMETLLAALYSARNLALHSGVFAATGDAILGRGGVILVDFTLEFLGNWYRNSETSQGQKTPNEVIEELASRQQRIAQRFAAHSGPLYTLNVGHLTSPNSAEAWDRS
jgi:hypothetical protein